jgi:hypothetical protein
MYTLLHNFVAIFPGTHFQSSELCFQILVYRLVGAAAIIVWGGLASCVMFGVLKWMGRLRVSEEEERQGELGVCAALGSDNSCSETHLVQNINIYEDDCFWDAAPCSLVHTDWERTDSPTFLTLFNNRLFFQLNCLMAVNSQLGSVYTEAVVEYIGTS